MTCECSNIGFCNRHNLFKDSKLYNLCKTEDGFKLFEKRRSPATLVDKVINVGIAVTNDIINGLKRVSKDVEKTRLDICSSCPLFDKNRTCMSCGCFVDIKVTIASEKCPEGKWGRDSNGKKCGSCGS